MEIKEWASNTAHLTLEEEAAYFRLVFYYYDSERPLPHDDLEKIFRKCRVPIELGKQIVLEFFRMDGRLGAWVHDRCEGEIEKYHAKIDRASKAGKASAATRSNARSTDVGKMFNQSLIINQESIINTKTATKVAAPEGVSSEVWDSFVKQRKYHRAVITDTVINVIRTEANKAGMTLEAALSECCARGWRGFKAEWVAEKQYIQRSDKTGMTVAAPAGQCEALQKLDQERHTTHAPDAATRDWLAKATGRRVQ